MAAVGTAPWYGVFPSQPCEQISQEDVLRDAISSNAQVRAGRRLLASSEPPGCRERFL